VKRRAINTVAALSLVLCLATLALRVRSCRSVDNIEWTRVDPLAREWSRQGLESWNGNILLDCRRTFFDKNGDVEKISAYEDFMPGWRFWSTSTSGFSLPDNPGQHIWNRLGFYSETRNSRDVNTKFSDTSSFRSLLFPSWFIILVTAPLPLLVCRRYVRQRTRHIQGRCLGCGYDLRATPERCPECGIVPKKTFEASK
jgi:hypothetical protein